MMTTKDELLTAAARDIVGHMLDWHHEIAPLRRFPERSHEDFMHASVAVPAR